MPRLRPSTHTYLNQQTGLYAPASVENSFTRHPLMHEKGATHDAKSIGLRLTEKLFGREIDGKSFGATGGSWTPTPVYFTHNSGLNGSKMVVTQFDRAIAIYAPKEYSAYQSESFDSHRYFLEVEKDGKRYFLPHDTIQANSLQGGNIFTKRLMHKDASRH